MNRSARLLCFYFACSLSFSSQLVAGEYYLIEQSHYHEKGTDDVCEKLVENFNRFKDEPPMVCERKFHPDFKGFTLPDWQEIDPKKYIETIERLLVKETKPSWGNAISGLKEQIMEGKFRLWKARIDINFDGDTNTVYRMMKYPCDAKRDYQRDGAPKFTYMAEQNEPNPEALGFRLLNGLSSGGIFYYWGRPYFHSWIQWPLFLSDRSRSVEGPSPRIAIYETSSPHTYKTFARSERCEIGYRE